MSRIENLKKYIEAAERLRIAIALNTSDTEFAARHKPIIYLCDTNVAEAYLRGGAKALSGSLGLMSEDAAQVNDSLTLQYLLSGKLPGQQGSPMYMSQWHWNETLNRIRVIEEQMQAGFARLPGNGGRITEDQLRTLQDLRDQPHQLIAKANEIGLGLLIDEVRKASTFDTRLKLAFIDSPKRSSKLQAIGLCKDYWPAAASHTRSTDVRRWIRLLTARRSMEPKHDGKKIGSSNIESDAQTLALIQALYRENPESLGLQPEVRFLLVTADLSIIGALLDRKDELEAEGIPNFVRHPLVFNPLINFSAMQRSVDSSSETDSLREVFFDVERAVRALLPDVESAPKLSPGRSQALGLLNNIRRWSKTAQNIAIVNPGLLAEELEEREISRQIADLFGDERVLHAAREAIRGTISTIKQEHARNMSTVAFNHLIRLLREPAKKDLFERRAPQKLEGVDLLENVRRRLGFGARRLETLDELLDSIALPGGRAADKETIEAVCGVLADRWDEPVTQLLAATIFLAVAAWDTSLVCADRCDELIRGSQREGPVLREARYCKALAYRMMLRSEREISLARDALTENLGAWDRDPVIFIRDSVERSTLTLSACIVQAAELHMLYEGFRRSEGFSRLVPYDGLQRMFDQETDALDRALQALDNYLVPGRKALIDGIAGQALVNRLGAEIFRRELGRQISERPADLFRVHGEMKEILEVIEYPLPLMGQVYFEVAAFALGDRTDGEVRALLESAGTKKGLAEGDKIEYDFLRQVVARASPSDKP